MGDTLQVRKVVLGIGKGKLTTYSPPQPDSWLKRLQAWLSGRGDQRSQPDFTKNGEALDSNE